MVLIIKKENPVTFNYFAELTYNDSLHLKLSSSGHFDLPHSPAISPCPSPALGQMPATEKVNIEELLGQLKASESLQEQADIIHYLYKHKWVLVASLCCTEFKTHLIDESICKTLKLSIILSVHYKI